MTIMDKEDEDLVKSSKRAKKIKKKKIKENKLPKENKIVNNSDKPIKKVKKKKQHVLFYKLLSFLLIILTVITLGHMIIEEIFPIFYLVLITIGIMALVLIFAFILNKRRLRSWIKNIFSFFSIILIVFEVLMLLFGTNTLKFLSNLTDTGYRVETFGIYVLDNSSYQRVEELEGKKLDYLKSDDDKNIKEALKKIKKQVHLEIDSKETAKDLVDELINNNVEAILMEKSYESILQEEYNQEFNCIRLLDEVDIVDVVTTIQSDVDITKNPFVVYVSGIDTSGNVASKARSDVNILIGVNPETKNILMVNTPRDYYVTLHSKKKKDKLTHAGLYGVEESLNTLSDLYDVDIDYYARINFTSFIKIVDALDGIKVDVPIKFCEQNSKRSKSNKICLNKGMQTLNGEQALALARHRHTLPTGDRGRGENQMLIMEAIMNKAMSPKVITKYSSLINALQGRVTTNMTTNEMIRFAKKQINNTSSWNYNSISATGTDSRGVCYATGSGKAYVMEPDMNSVYAVRDAFDRLFEGEQEVIVKNN